MNFLASEEGFAAGRDEEQQFKATGMNGVRSFVMNEALLFFGTASEPTIMAAALQ